jgi:hypothetical protein
MFGVLLNVYCPSDCNFLAFCQTQSIANNLTRYLKSNSLFLVYNG